MEGLQWAVVWRMPQVIIESDCAQIVAMMGNAAENGSQSDHSRGQESRLAAELLKDFPSKERW